MGVRPAWTRYLLLTFRCTALSDEKRDSVLRLGINLANGSTLDGMLDRLWQQLEGSGGDIEPGREAPPGNGAARPVGTLPCLAERLERMLPVRVQSPARSVHRQHAPPLRARPGPALRLP